MGKEKSDFCCHKIFVPNGLSAPTWGYIHVKKKKKKKKLKKTVKKIRLQRDFFKLATNGQSDKEFLLTSNNCPQGVVCPCPGAIYIIKSFKMRLKSYFKEIVLKLATNGQSHKGF